MHPLKRLAENLRYLRSQAGATQGAFAEFLDFEIRFYQRLEDAERENLHFSTIQRIADKVKLEPWELLAPEIESRGFEVPKRKAKRQVSPRARA